MRRSVVGIVVVGAVIAVAILAWQRHGGGADAPSAGSAGGSAGAPVDVAAARRQAHANLGELPHEPASMSGTVTRKSDGAGVPNAVVALAHAGNQMSFGETTGDGPTIAITDAHGAWTASPLEPASYAVSATALGYASASLPAILLASGERHANVALVLDEGAPTLRGTVSDVGGGPVAGAHVAAFRRDSDRSEARAELVGIAGADGSYALALADGGWTVKAMHDDYTQQHKQITLAGKPKQLDFVLVPGSQIRGTVVARADGKPVPNAIVTASSAHSRGGGGGAHATSDATGAFTLHGLRAGSISLTAQGPGVASSSPTMVDVGIGELTDGVRVVVDRGYAISGYVVHKGKPDQGIAGIHVGGFSMAAMTGAGTLVPTGSDGYFELAGVRPATYMLFAMGEGVTAEMSKSVEVTDHDVRDVIIEMAAGATITGRVEPPQIASISLAPESIGIGNIMEAARAQMSGSNSDATGAFALLHAPPGKLVMTATANDGSQGKLPIEITDADQHDLVITLQPRASLSGRIVDTSHAPVAGVHITVAPVSDSHADVSFSIADAEQLVMTDDDGAFHVVGLAAGKVHLAVSDSHGALAWSGRDKPREPLAFDVVTGKDTPAGTLVVDASNGTIHGVVLGPDGKPTPDAWITSELTAGSDEDVAMMRARMMAQFGNDDLPALSGADGTFTLTHLRKGAYKLVAEGPRGASRAEKDGVAVGDQVTLTLAALATISGHVTSGGAAVTSFDLECTGPEMQGKHVDAADGAYTLDRLAPGTYACSATADVGAASGSASVTTSPVTLDLAIAAYASVTGVVVSSIDGSPVAGLIVLAQTSGAQMQGLAELITGGGPHTDASGRFTVGKLAAGSGQAMIMSNGGSSPLATRPLTLVAGQRFDLGTIKVVPPRTGDAGTLGMGTSIDGTTLSVASVAAGGPAETAGIAVGDKIVAIGSTPVAEMGPAVAKSALGAGTIGAGQTFALTLDRGGTPVTVSVTAAKW